MSKLFNVACYFSFFIILVFQGCAQSEVTKAPSKSDFPRIEGIRSPQGKLWLQFYEQDGELYYSLRAGIFQVLEKSKMGFKLKEGDLSEGFKITKVEKSSFKETWTQPWGEVKDIENHYSELKAEVQKNSGEKMNIVFRVYDYGLGFRYEWPEQELLSEFTIMDELTEFNLIGNHKSWSIEAYIPNRSEHLYEEKPLFEVDTVQTPFTMQTEDGLYLSIHEAALTDYASMSLANNGNGSLEADLVPWKNGDKVYVKVPHVSPWRTIQVAEKPGDLITNYLILNLNEPSKIEDTSWIKPSKYVGIWWDMHIQTKTWDMGRYHGATTEYTKEWMDFAAKHGFDGVLVEGWNKGWGRDEGYFSYTEAYPDFDIEEVTSYGDSLGVKLIGHHETYTGISNYERQVDEAFALYKKLGVEAIKTGYVGDFVEGGEWHHGQYMVRHYRDIVEKAAAAKIMLNVHEPIKDTGIRRTWPNMMTREGARGQEFNAWSEDGGNPPSHTTTIPFTRLLGGPMDYTPGVFNLLLSDKQYNPIPNRVKSTLAKELALYVVIYSPMHMAADLIKNLEAKPMALQFVKDVPVDWEKTKVLAAEIGDYIVTARKDRNSEDWYLGGITNEDAREIEIDLSFLDYGTRYEAQIYADGFDAHWETEPYLMQFGNIRVNRTQKMNLKLAAGGGAAIRFKALN